MKIPRKPWGHIRQRFSWHKDRDQKVPFWEGLLDTRWASVSWDSPWCALRDLWWEKCPGKCPCGKGWWPWWPRRASNDYSLLCTSKPASSTRCHYAPGTLSHSGTKETRPCPQSYRRSLDEVRPSLLKSCYCSTLRIIPAILLVYSVYSKTHSSYILLYSILYIIFYYQYIINRFYYSYIYHHI